MFAVDRGVFDHPKLCDRKPLTKLEAWLWLISSAAWKPISRRLSGRVIELERGQLAASTRFLADRWRWKEPRVRRFLNLLKTDAAGDAEIDTATDAGITVITIRKYNRYQRVSLPTDATVDTRVNAAADAAATRDRRKEEDIEGIQPSEANASALYEDAKHQLWAEGVPILVSLGKKEVQSRKMIGLWLKQTSDNAPSVLDAIQRARDRRVREPIAWITQALNGSKSNGTQSIHRRTNPLTGPATARETGFLSALGQGALECLESHGPAGSERMLSKDNGAPRRATNQPSSTRSH